ncbi:MAG: 23S rRNA (adenine(2503)-C(2))-methyltransferase RlmN [Thermoguttaceae bacterium]|nr:23S rRNA (adenine(2503)-C(2))-methyltransferase RlmN [Thermoguttaceae bacterium]MBQ2038213.1 23S rRNA (adenine(2503)-C(2))-methyltransferase RlmN [Thermoguttaceae bacterium]MBQ2556517.1 23S rRNA (adenine(2503)-C(2))-methyltransferase RlmN [Thermoguttaceae bacterium]MBQ3821585.1 23S rRNA (adenine(2503)-C(2))-methyltransferase RlmN [Thermoguttaceae bacterium]MBQ5366262.1 23S rRNA (adenine(2503)-C(2))-methyltransferase RlmN [Thermoguttaceae bacterium]
MNENYKPLLSYSKEELTDLFKTLGLPAFRAGQVRRWVFSRKTDRFSQMSDLSKDLRAKLTELFARPKSGAEPAKLIANGSETVAAETFDYDDSLYESRVVAKSVSDDGSEKLLLEWRDGRRVECVLLRDDRNHRTACVSVQVGCAMGCVFCCSGMGGFVRNLTRSEILEELLRLNALLPQDERLTHIVVMGTGEPTLNLDALLPALAEATSGDGLDIGNRRVTISTVGIPAGIRKLAEANVPYKLAVSLHAPNDRIRDAIMPQNRIHPIAEVLRAADVFFHTTGRRVTFEYVLLDGINSSVDDALELARLLRNKTAIVNCIPYNPAPELPYKTPSNATVRRFVDALEGEGIQVKVRFRKGDKINAACGQLRWSLREKE